MITAKARGFAVAVAMLLAPPLLTGCHGADDPNLPHDSSANPKASPTSTSTDTTGNPKKGGIAPPSP